VYIDEIDKIAARDPENAGAQGSDIGGRDVQYELLKLVEGGKVAIKTGGMLGQGSTIEIDTTNILFICGGAFPDLDNVIKERLHQKTSMGFNAQLKDEYDETKQRLSSFQRVRTKQTTTRRF